jgi:hypothetical protein
MKLAAQVELDALLKAGAAALVAAVAVSLAFALAVRGWCDQNVASRAPAAIRIRSPAPISTR